MSDEYGDHTRCIAENAFTITLSGVIAAALTGVEIENPLREAVENHADAEGIDV